MNKNIKKRSWHKKWWGIIIILIIIFIFSLILVSGLYVYEEFKRIKDLESSKIEEIKSLTVEELSVIVEGKNNFWTGSINPEITIVQFVDFSCPACLQFSETIRRIGIKYSDQVKIIHRDLPVITENSLDLAIVANCAGDQDLFWPMHDKLFQNQGEVFLSNSHVLAQQIGVDIEEYSDCINSNKKLPGIRSDIVDADKLNIQGTPTIFVNNYKIEAVITFEEFSKLIDTMLKK